jgi:hypothetical protein
MKELAIIWSLRRLKTSRINQIFLTRYQAKSTIVNPNISNVDIFTVVSDEAAGYVNYSDQSWGVTNPTPWK